MLLIAAPLAQAAPRELERVSASGIGDGTITLPTQGFWCIWFSTYESGVPDANGSFSGVGHERKPKVWAPHFFIGHAHRNLLTAPISTSGNGRCSFVSNGRELRVDVQPWESWSAILVRY